jgi:cation diffusion facilitator family transporter
MHYNPPPPLASAQRPVEPNMAALPSHSPQSSRAELRAALLSLGLSLVLLVVKFVAYFLTRSNAVFSDALENIVNVLGSGFAVYAIALAHRPADTDHPYGHGKIEFFSAGLEGGMILLAAVLIVGKVAVALYNHQAPNTAKLDIALMLMTAAFLLNGAVGLFLWQIGRRRGSLTLEADGTHLLSDAFTSAVVILALVIVRFTGWSWVDSAAALLAAAYIGYLGLRLLRRATAGLMDEQDLADQKLLRTILDSHLGPGGKQPLICSYHKVRLRHSGRYHWVDFHIMMPAWWEIHRAHQVASGIEYEIELALGEGNATAHVEPCIDPDCPYCRAEKQTAARTS